MLQNQDNNSYFRAMQSLLLLKIHHIDRPVPDSMVVYFEPPLAFSYTPGQHITLLITRNGRELRRSYSLCTLPSDPYPAIAIRKVVNGEVSRYLLDQLQPGDVLQSLAPTGRFTLQQASHQVFFAAGSGITPILPLIQQALQRKEASVELYYSESSPEHCLFYRDLLNLQSQHPHQLQIHWHFSQLINRGTHLNGRLNQYIIEKAFANKAAADRQKYQFYLCGPMAYMRMIRLSLQFMGYAAEQIKRENFASEGIPLQAKTLEPLPSFEVQVRLGQRNFTMRSEQTILAGAQTAGLPLPYSCNNGQCGSCTMKLEKGQVRHRINEVLTDKELEEGYFLSCSALPASPLLVVAT